VLEGPGDAEVDQPRRHSHDDVVGLHVEMDEARSGHVLKRAGEVQGERQCLLERQGAAALDQPPQRGPLEVLDQQVRALAGQDRVKAANQDRMGEARQHLCLLGELAQGLLVLGLVGTKQLGDRERVKALVPDQVDLVAVAAAKALQRVAVGGDRLALGQLPARVGAHRSLQASHRHRRHNPEGV
jgi:hypothetical protein